jgi:hypothetical protein
VLSRSESSDVQTQHILFNCIADGTACVGTPLPIIRTVHATQKFIDAQEFEGEYIGIPPTQIAHFDFNDAFGIVNVGECRYAAFINYAIPNHFPVSGMTLVGKETDLACVSGCDVHNDAHFLPATIRYCPSAPHASTADFTWKGNTATTSLLKVTAEGNADAVSIVTPEKIDFGDVPLGNASYASVHLENIGLGEIVGHVDDFSSSAFSCVYNCNYKVGAGKTNSIDIIFAFTPNTLGQTSKWVPLSDVGTITLSGKGVK